MKIFIPIAVAAATVSTVSGATTWIDGLTKIENSDSYHMKHVHVVQARVQSDAPLWNATTETFGSRYYKTAEEQFRGLLDTVNTASVEGALMYVQAEGIDVTYQSTKCERKNNMKYVVFYDIVVAQTNETLAEYEAEYGPFLAMDGGRCNQVNGTESEECLSLNGNSTLNVPSVGPFVGGSEKQTDSRAPYENCWWYSFPNTCPLQPWKTKTAECRANTRQGLCDLKELPDGIKCTYNYRVLGYVPLDDVVGITSLKNKAGTGTYANYSEFCTEGGVEFKTESNKLVDSLPFWEKPSETSENTKRAQKLLTAYGDMLTSKKSSQITSDDIGHMKSLPAVNDLVTENPKCYENVKKCATATHGCKRELYGQICTVCNAAANGCEVAPTSFKYPSLAKAIAVKSSEGNASSGSSSENTPTPTPTSSSTSLAITVSALVASLGLSVLLG
ncbi:cleavage induced hypothetical protein [Phytophthora infestans T30-4]|uniref:Secreted protein n=2 Tax=Phytophthora infestans TaxID=4787 RepID=D0MUM7_PHYIT|nr:cleavage induced hypothetical protein [Phytophthora infestans T30-4]EEY61674.1 cleavage induced hypothetical protein [Phytophthora infestans T30-4]KAF4030297.1 hypothetical protein GN244_ATG17987 [Phytophthora infestans]KAF4140434.1 hypothetical protein GN958_ATG10431 [Phytophthora infestans]KAI9993487.1 hypothetical protein PInf_015594 [Phytophthora infestans]|eukprot:XP_002908591.1 cleavage induced hypothetical protein [Phytophthora infestans T30-4]